MRVAHLINGTLDRAFGVQIKKTPAKHGRTSSTRSVKRPLDFSDFNLEPYLEELNTTFKKSLDSPKFLDNTRKPKSLHIGVNRYVQVIRLELPTENYFHLHSILLLGDNGEPLELKNEVQVEISSQNLVFDKLSADERKDKLLSPDGKHAHAFYTNYEHRPWVTISFASKQHIGGLVINNKAGVNALRAAGLLVSVSRNPSKWKALYDLGGVKNFEEAAKRVSNNYSLFNYDHGEQFFKFITLLLEGNGTATKELYKQMPEKYKPRIRQSVNQIILQSRKLELMAHGARRTFRFWKTEKKQEFVRATAHVIEDLQSLSPDVCLGFGSVLGAIRDKDLMPHDNDTDVIVAFKTSEAPTINAALKLVKKHMESKGYSVDNELFSGWNVRRDGFKVDVFVGLYEKDGTIGWYPGPRKVLKRDDVFPAKKTSLLGVDCLVPKHPEKYLKFTYGEDWQTPNPGHTHGWDSSAYDDLKND